MAAKRLSQRALARELCLSPGRITQLMAKGMPVYSVEAARAWRAQNVAPTPTGKDQSGGRVPVDHTGGSRGDDDDDHAPPGYLQSRARREAAEANLAELREGELRGELIRVSAVESAWSTALAGFRDALLQMPGRIGAGLAAESDVAAVMTQLEDEINQALCSLAGTPGAEIPVNTTDEHHATHP